MFYFIYKIFGRIRNFFYKLHLKIKFFNRIKIGKNVIFRKNVNIIVEKNAKLIIGNNCFFNNNCSINCMKYIEIGSNNLFGENVKIYDHDHVINEIDRSKKFSYNDIFIGDNNWFGSNCIILRKSKIGSKNVFSCNTIINTLVKDSLLIRNNYNITYEKINYKEEG